MAQPTEHDIQNTIAETLIWDGWLVMRINSGAMRPDDGERYVSFVSWQSLGWNWRDSGVGDLLAMRDGEGVVIEVKTHKGRQRKSQKEFQTACEERGVQYILARSLDDVTHLLARVEYDGPRPGMRAIEVQDE